MTDPNPGAKGIAFWETCTKLKEPPKKGPEGPRISADTSLRHGAPGHIEQAKRHLEGAGVDLQGWHDDCQIPITVLGTEDEHHEGVSPLQTWPYPLMSKSINGKAIPLSDRDEHPNGEIRQRRTDRCWKS